MPDHATCYETEGFRIAATDAVKDAYVSSELFKERTGNMEKHLGAISKRVWFMIALMLTNSAGMAATLAVLYLRSKG